nr:outer membrane beta-barrel protein [Chitinophagaceae bacterium]
MLRKGLLMVCLFGSLIAAAQTGNVQVKITNTENKALENVTVELLHDGDSSLVKITVTDNSGLAEFEDIAFGKYLLRASSVNYITGFSSLVDFSNNTLVTVPTIKLATKPKDLQDVTVITHKPFIQRMTDRIVVNVDNSIVNAGNTAMEVLQRSPGVLVDQNDNISLRGRSGVTIMMDGKPTAMSGADLANYLKSLPSSAIKQIDIITNPSAKYDAAGNAGIIDIKMKKDQRYGTNGTVTASYGQGVYPKVNGGIQMNYRNKKINVFGNYNQSYRIGLNHLFLDRNFYNNGVYNGGDLKDNYFKIPMQGNTARIGMDYSPSEKTIIGFIVNGSFYNRESENKNHSILINPQHQQVSIFNSLSNNNNKNNNIVSNLNFKHQFNNEGKELSADLNYGSFWSNALTRIHTTYYDLDGNKLQPDYILDGDQKGKLYFTTGRIDYTQPLSGKAKLEMGFKTSFVSSDNDVKFYDVSSGTPENDVNKTNHFLYKES